MKLKKNLKFKIALICGNDSYVGREYAKSLIRNKINFDLILIGKKLKNNIDKKRTNNFWKPPKLNEMKKTLKNIFYFKNMNKFFFEYLDSIKYDLAIQGGGLGILNKEIISKFKIGIINFHPGSLPEFRGSSAPEYQFLQKQKTVCTCHLIDENIDQGYLLKKKKLKLSYKNYYKFRASIYPEIAKFLIEILFNLKMLLKLKKKVKKNTPLMPYIGDDVIKFIIINWKVLVKIVK